MLVLSTHRWHQSSRMSWCAYWGANSGSSLSCVRTRWSCCRDSRITLMPFRAPLWAMWRGWLTPSRNRSVSLFANVAWQLRSRRLRGRVEIWGRLRKFKDLGSMGHRCSRIAWLQYNSFSSSRSLSKGKKLRNRTEKNWYFLSLCH